jgi:SNF2 family DNA or RNA helicase
VLAAITALKQICNHPAAYRTATPTAGGTLRQAHPLDQIVDNVFEADERVLIFTHFATWGEKLAKYLTARTGRAGRLLPRRPEPAGPATG